MKKKISVGGILTVLLLIVLQFTGILPRQGDQLQKEAQQTTATTAAQPIENVDLNDPPRFKKIAVTDIRNVDGDTFAFYSNQKEYKLRLLIVDTPESVKPGMNVQPFGKEASAFTKKMLKKEAISIVFDKGAVRDNYGRYLAYVYVGDEMLQTALLKEGLGIVRYVNTGGDSYIDELITAQAVAQKAKRGVWQEENYVVKKKNGFYQYNEK
ncbi:MULTISPECIES: thermonuclease family protein [Enterococcus]|jgi:micrococcal nuclease|uniref:TNase-like domain-containing protein n=1 Tax=Enterococcus dispar ATCC 51266 TaxID=1139219 RepID=S1N7J8_9ENTE|nr:thermonuclease family protein [Enterococcus dispar]EOT43512.1 hypothetical protein OMK_00867 [Enterococcus dispar ATCC 51266]EOW85040.1 hypothetical protein I569_00333 [Enterococcus dispar ATCC 51266]MCU7358249.1 thermonuclease family protein [Enterococcus dispar]MDT2706409.1 thermonuclease family protein [Enterococcus dispar]OJG39931.1 hypothetical protein RV01_GL000005 [Enterococcus dispar]